MFDATLPSETPPAAFPKRVVVEGRAELAWKAEAGRTALDHLYNSDPLRFLFPRREPGQPETAVLVTTSGGLVGGDRLHLEISAGPGAAGLAMTQAAEKVYGSAGPQTVIEAELRAAPDAWLEWLPHETILFDAAKMTRRTRLHLAPGAQAITGEILVFGRAASGETLTTGNVRETWEVRRDGRLIWADAFDVDNTWSEIMNAAAGLNGHRALATVVAAAADPLSARDAVRAALATAPDGVDAAASEIAGLVIVRILARRTEDMRATLAQAWGALRTAMGPFADRLPRLWHL